MHIIHTIPATPSVCFRPKAVSCDLDLDHESLENPIMNGIKEAGSVQAVTLINQKIEGLEERIRELRQIKELLTRSSNGGGTPRPAGESTSEFSPLQLPPRARQLWDWVKAHAPVTRKDIKDKSGVSAGTVANYLRPEYGFALVSRGLWDVIGANREQRQ